MDEATCTRLTDEVRAMCDALADARFVTIVMSTGSPSVHEIIELQITRKTGVTTLSLNPPFDVPSEDQWPGKKSKIIAGLHTSQSIAAALNEALDIRLRRYKRLKGLLPNL